MQPGKDLLGAWESTIDYEHNPFKPEGEVLMIKWPGESDYRKFTRVQD
jgi:hypothetical protein